MLRFFQVLFKKEDMKNLQFENSRIENFKRIIFQLNFHIKPGVDTGRKEKNTAKR